ncbi:MAG: MBL fold metallo-hydrolase [Candidatus Nanoarchaeia archaeon]|nr:MBL fold metallo-hydrolase [Candidatus Nanoarchaeia archaeon]MDD5238975.1 MBL fold metallo-hydrolase [Candidatus Nanoarchaeia archaeon]
MAEVKVLIKGYASELKNGWTASSTTTFIESNGKKIIVDPGCNRKNLLDSLKRVGLHTNDIDLVVLTHMHPDHSLLCGIFENAKVLTPTEIYDNDKQVEQKDKIEGTDIKIMLTPGHVPEHISLVVPTSDGIVVVAGDNFWWGDNEEQKVDINKEDAAHPTETDMDELVKSRKKILKIADWVIPGHGKMFRVEK